MQPNNFSKVKPTRILGIDFGLKRIGLALSDERKILASPFMTFPAERRMEQTVVKLVELIHKMPTTHQCEIEAIVIGLPLMMNGTTGFLADEVQHFVKLLQSALNIPIHTWDERLTSVQAERSLKEGNMTRKKRAQVVDRVSAVIILQTYLDSKSTFSI